jgi:hypothetical protein
VVWAAESRLRNNATLSRRPNSAARCFLAQPEMSAVIVIIANELGLKSLQMGFIQSDGMVE